MHKTMSRSLIVLTVALAAVTVPLVGLIRKDLHRIRVKNIQLRSLTSPKGFEGVAHDGARYSLDGQEAEARFGLFVLHANRLEQEIIAWNDIQARLASARVKLVGTCENAACVTELRRTQSPAQFTVLAATGMAQAQSLAHMDDNDQWMLCDRSGTVEGVFPIPKNPDETRGLIQAVLRRNERGTHAQS